MTITLEILQEVIEELSDEQYDGKIHGHYNAYSAGCNGILCRKYNRDKVREQYRKANPVARRARGPRNPELDKALAVMIASHKKNMLEARAETQLASVS